ncbi:two-component system sensor histidine kinase MtrB [Nocardioides luteus]|uniref:histidine kinase n=1 Tax=Nocardioides luteus TaxID=1844 RepID=A0ABQ5T2D0_9ACTN|nr:HAMP domain-containing sensor histidine kinase [Nocardioides luteus]MDR7311600.1 two-component system sensor histidine kinase MtrB [Nocardioides luteus]GGR54495.1 two-component sensor histidine kinase [Nocardioides luteus]GLJ70249.1 two-component sensor histidine kinase [Nocardioides luteus]
MTTRRSWLRGLRSRLIAGFVVVTVLGAGAAVWAGVRQASEALVESSQSQQVTSLVSQITATAPSVAYPLTDQSIEQLRVAAGTDSLVVAEDRASGDGVLADGVGAVPAELRDNVRDSDGRVSTQRIEIDGTPWLLIGTPVMLTDPSGSRKPSGVEVYVARDLRAVEEDVRDLITSAAGAALLVLPLAVIIAVLAARSVLRPVDRLRTTARRLADGDLSARTDPAGADELAQLTDAVNDMAESLQRSMAELARMEDDARRFAADVSHELRTPLTTLTATVELLHDALSQDAGPVDEDVRESAQLAVLETRRLVRLVEDVIEIARLDAGTADVRREPTDLADVVRACLQARGWEEVEVGGSAPAVSADRRRVDLIVANLVGNALRHGRPPVRVTLSSTADDAVVTVSDGGDGIRDDVLPHVFGRFYKADPARARTPGSGLGLAIAAENARLHGGTVTAANAPGGGAVFTLRLPAVPTPEEGR